MKVPRALAALSVAWLAVFGRIQAVTLEVKEGNATCIEVELSASFSISYNTSGGNRTAQLALPDSAAAVAGGSSCGTAESAAVLLAAFGPGHTLGLVFSTRGNVYNVSLLTLQYNLSDASVFPEANRSGVVTVVSGPVGIWAAINTTYRCVSPLAIGVGEATATLSDVRLQAFMPGNDLSPEETVCAADQNSTTAPPTTTPSTTAPPTTTAAPAPAPAPGTPVRGSYTVNDNNGTLCLLAQMGLQLNVSYFSRTQNKTVQQLLNLNPNHTSSSGSCEASSASLILTQEQTTTLNFTFTMNTTAKKYHLSGISLLADWSDMSGALSASNTSLDYLRSTLGHSYMCNAEQTLLVVPAFSLNTFRLQVQPFGVTTDQFSTAEECQMDQDQMLIPIIVGAALAGLVLIVLVAYLIGRKRSHAGYQTI
ncbi:lysosome-associated membrane glycoprotein 1a [Embiotoca jacksoni]|uniref:lysosome-associated membrane glycoprotein 1a n=1 Tax=Embiotoca jacksoni TaxID=100190 RepID=UPI003703A6CF